VTKLNSQQSHERLLDSRLEGFPTVRRQIHAGETELLGAARAGPFPVTRILVADDDCAVRGMIEFILRSESFEVTTARNGYDAIDLFRSGTFSLVILDWHMPGLNGEFVLDELSTIRPGTGAIVVSGDSPLAVRRAFSGRNVLALLPKPFKPNDLLNAVKSALAR